MIIMILKELFTPTDEEKQRLMQRVAKVREHAVEALEIVLAVANHEAENGLEKLKAGDE